MPLDVTIPDFRFLEAGQLAGMIDPARTALFVIDIQRDFCAPDGFSGRVGSDMSTMEPAIRLSTTIPA